MSEQLTVLFEQLRGSQPPAPFASPEQVRRRGRQRNHRQALAAGSAVLAVAGLGTGWALGTAGDDPKPPTVSQVPPTSEGPSPSWSSSSPSSSPASPSVEPTTPEAVPASAMLRPADFAALSGVTTSQMDDQGRDGPPWPWQDAESCPAFRASDYPTVRQRRDVRGADYIAGEWSGWEIVERYPDASANMADVRRILEACPTYQGSGGGVEVHQAIVDEGFVGDDSLLVRMEFGADLVHYVVVVRLGDLVATLHYRTTDSAEARQMAEPMAARLQS